MKDKRFDILKKAEQTATGCLRRCYDSNGIVAGRHQFSDYWARDSFFACLGALEIGDNEIVRKNLELFLRFQRADGEIPLKIGGSALKKVVMSALNLKTEIDNKRLIPSYNNIRTKWDKSLDQNSLLVTAAFAYLQKRGDLNFIKENYRKLESAILWSATHDSDSDLLIEEKPYCNWADSVKKQGKVLYTNVLYYKALMDFAEVSKIIGNKKNYFNYKTLAEQVGTRINKLFWNKEKGFYSDFLPGGREYFSTEGNLLAIIFGICNIKRAKMILSFIEKNRLNKPVASKTNFPKYKTSMIYLPLRIFGMAGYHNCEQSWLWIGCLEAIARKKIGEDADFFLEQIAKKIMEYNMVYEVYDEKGAPVRKPFYRSEHPFAWSSGMFVYAARYKKMKEG